MKKKMTTWDVLCLAIVLLLPIPSYAKKSYLVKIQPRAKGEQSIKLLKSLGLKLHKTFPEIQVYAVDADSDDDRIKRDPLLQSVAEYVVDDGVITIDAKPNDDGYSVQKRQMERTRWEKAWNQARGSRDIVVAVSDTGVNLKHPDLKNQLWKNPNEIAGNKVDDDGNGYIDDVYGWNSERDNGDPSDDNSHGSHVAGIIGAEGNNKIGIAGVNWNVTIMPLKFISSSGQGTDSDAIETILYAVKNGAKIINCSWGGHEYNQALKDAIDYAYSKNVLVIAAAGNDGKATEFKPLFPGAFDTDGVISVAASEWDGRLAYFSNFGELSTDLAAPGWEILSTVLGKGYDVKSGTSMATPVVSGVAALILSVAPQLTAHELRNAVLNATNWNNGYEGLLSTQGDINIEKAVNQLSQGFQVWPQAIKLSVDTPYTFTAYQPLGSVQWSVVPSNHGSIDERGTFVGTVAGDVKVIATDSSGKSVSTSHLSIIDPVEAGYACSQKKDKYSKPTGVQTANAIFNMSMPFMIGFWIRRRQVKK